MKNNVDTSEPITHVSHCAGYAGIDLGLSRVIPSLRTIAYCEIEAFAIANLVAKIEAGQLDAAPLWTDIKTFPFRQFHGLVDIYSAGFPCQPFSAAGKRGADEDPRHLFPHIKSGIEQMQPSVVFLENVEGIISAKLSGDGWNDPAGTPVLLHVLRELERLGYRATAGVFSASEVGAPHQRKRVFILAYRNESRSQRWNCEVLQKCSGQWPVGQSDSSMADGSNDGLGRGKTTSVQGGCSERSREHSKPEYAGQLSRRLDFAWWPSRPGEEQFKWEPPRTVANPERSDKTWRQSGGGEKSRGRAHYQSRRPSSQSRQIESALGGDVDGDTRGLGYAELCESCDSRVDELRLLGNGVVPAVVERAFRILFQRMKVCINPVMNFAVLNPV